jgi:DNA-binding FadR family transcriptional regulator
MTGNSGSQGAFIRSVEERVEEVAATLCDRIIHGRYPRRLPSQSELAEELGVLERVVALAIRQLVKAKYVETRPHEGTFVRPSGDWGT